MASGETICLGIVQWWPRRLTIAYGVSFAPIGDVGVDAHLRDDRAALRVLRAVDPRRVDERVRVVALAALDAGADAAVHAGPQVLRLLLVGRVRHVPPSVFEYSAFWKKQVLPVNGL